MKSRFATLIVFAFVAAATALGCGDSATTTQPDTSPPLAPVVLGARGADGSVGIWWRQNTEPDLAGYLVYVTRDGMTQRVTTTPIPTNFMTWECPGAGQVSIYVTAVDWSRNESSPSATREVSVSSNANPLEHIDGLTGKDVLGYE